jgi:hypothetical protein
MFHKELIRSVFFFDSESTIRVKVRIASLYRYVRQLVDECTLNRVFKCDIYKDCLMCCICGYVFQILLYSELEERPKYPSELPSIPLLSLCEIILFSFLTLSLKL